MLPSVAKLVHHHEGSICQAKHENHFHSERKLCPICNFTFSVFLSEKTNIVAEKIEFSNHYYSPFHTFFYKDLTQYSFLLRAPPLFTNLV